MASGILSTAASTAAASTGLGEYDWNRTVTTKLRIAPCELFPGTGVRCDVCAAPPADPEWGRMARPYRGSAFLVDCTISTGMGQLLRRQ